MLILTILPPTAGMLWKNLIRMSEFQKTLSIPINPPSGQWTLTKCEGFWIVYQLTSRDMNWSRCSTSVLWFEDKMQNSIDWQQTIARSFEIYRASHVTKHSRYPCAKVGIFIELKFLVYFLSSLHNMFITTLK